MSPKNSSGKSQAPNLASVSLKKERNCGGFIESIETHATDHVLHSALKSRMDSHIQVEVHSVELDMGQAVQ